MKREDLQHLVGAIERSLKPYRDVVPSFARLPEKGRAKEDILADVDTMAAHEEARWRDGYASGAVYNGDEEHIAFLNEVYARNSQLNPLHPDLWPRATKYEAEVASMTAGMLGADLSPSRDDDGGVCGLVTSGGTESILTAMRCARDQARAERGVTDPELVVPFSAHVAFDKAAQYFGMRLVRVPVGEDGKADPAAMADAITPHTAALVGSAPSFPWGVVDPIPDLSGLARERGVWFHTDGCLGGFVLPWAARLGEDLPAFDFRLPGVTSMSADTHKFGYAAKGTSVVLFRNADLRRYSYYMTEDSPIGLYNSPTMAGSRPGALSAEAWAAMLAMGESGYLDATQRILDTTKEIRAGVAEIPELRLLGDSVFVVAFGSDAFDVYAVADEMSARHWNLNGLQMPASLHLCVTLRHTQPGVAARFLEDLRASVAAVAAEPGRGSVMAPIYGLGRRIESEVSISDVLTGYLDSQFKV